MTGSSSFTHRDVVKRPKMPLRKVDFKRRSHARLDDLIFNGLIGNKIKRKLGEVKETRSMNYLKLL